MADLKKIVNQLHLVLSCDQVAHDRQFELKQRLEQLQQDIEPYEKVAPASIYLSPPALSTSSLHQLSPLALSTSSLH